MLVTADDPMIWMKGRVHGQSNKSISSRKCGRWQACVLSERPHTVDIIGITKGVIIVKKFVKPLQIKKPEMKEEDFVQEELDRVLVPVEDEEIKKQMDEAAKKDGE